MTELDISVGKELMGHLCEECRERMNAQVTRKDILRCLTGTRGYKRLVNKIETLSCESCQAKIWARGRA